MCDYCHNIQEWKKFNAPKDYLACIEYIQQLVTNGGFELLEEESTALMLVPLLRKPNALCRKYLP